MYRRDLRLETIERRAKALLNELRPHIYAEKETFAPVLYAPAEKKADASSFAEVTEWKTLPQGGTLGGSEARFLIRCELPRRREQAGRPRRLLVHTGARNIWNNDNPQFYVYVNGEISCGLDINHHHVVLPSFTEEEMLRQPKDIADLYLYTNTGRQDVFLQISTAVLDEDVKDLYYDLLIATELLGLLKEEDPGLYELSYHLNEAMNLLDLRDLRSGDFRKSIGSCRDYLEEKIYREGAFVPYGVRLHSVGSTHIDVAWLWTLAQTREKVIRSAATALALMDQYPEYIFMLSQPQLYLFLKEEAPELYARVKEKVREGRWDAEGGCWVEPDCNLPSGESFVRQMYYGKRFFKEEFGVDSEVLWVPDTFGYSPVLPQLMKLAGLRYFVTSKISWNDSNLFPYDTFYWQGLDGSRVLNYFITTKDYIKYPDPDKLKDYSSTYNGTMTCGEVLGSWQRYQSKHVSRDLFQCFGFGDGGGGPTAEMLERQRRLQYDLPGIPRVLPGFIKSFLQDLEENIKDKDVPVSVGEMPLEYHRGTLTTMALIKKLNRRAEFSLLNAEFLTALSAYCLEDKTDPACLEEAWKTILKNQFHDILPGSSIEPVYPESERDYRGVITETAALSEKKINLLADAVGTEKDGVLVFNPHGFALPAGCAECFDNAETVPPLGWAVLTEERPSAEPVSWDEASLTAENKFYRLRFDENGRLLSLYDKEAERELIPEGRAGNCLQLFEDRPLEYEAWNTEKYADETVWPIQASESLRCLEKSPRCLRLGFASRFGRSELRQEIIIYAERRLIEFKTDADWQEEKLFLKTDFPLDLRATEGRCDIQFGNISRSLIENTSWDEAHFEVMAHHWADISEGGYGVALINDAKYAYHLRQGLIRLSLLRSPKSPNPRADMGRHRFRYALYPHQGHWRDCRLIEEAELFNRPCIERKIKAKKGLLPSRFSLMDLGSEDLFCSAVKLAETEENALLIRVYESRGKSVLSRMRLPEQVKKAEICNLLEETMEELLPEKGEVRLRFRPYEIKTLKLYLS